MATRKAYAASNDGHCGFMFKSKALRDFFIANVDGYKAITCSEYRKIERGDNDSVDQWGNTVRFASYSAYDMSIGEYWDGWWDVYDMAEAQGLL